MTSLIMIVVSSALVSNVVLNQFLGICSFLGVSKQIKTSASLGAAVIFVITIASAVASLLYDYVLAPLNLDYLKTIVFILVIAALVQLVEMFLKKTSRAIYEALGIYLPLITTNCAVLGVALTNVQNGYNLLESVLSGFGTAIGYTIAIVLLAGIRGRSDEEAIPAAVPRSTDCSSVRGAYVHRIYGLQRTVRRRKICRKLSLRHWSSVSSVLSSVLHWWQQERNFMWQWMSV